MKNIYIINDKKKLVIHVGMKIKHLQNWRLYFQLQKKFYQVKRIWSRREALPLYATLPRANPNILAITAKLSPWCIPLINIISNGSSYKGSLIKGLWQEIWKMKILVGAIYLPLRLPPNFRNRRGRAHLCSAHAVILSLVIPLLTALMSILKKDVWKLERNYRKNWWYRNLALRLETKTPQCDLLNNKRGQRCLDPSL